MAILKKLSIHCPARELSPEKMKVTTIVIKN